MEQLGEFITVKPKGLLLPWNKETEQPCFILIEDVMFIPVFSDTEKIDSHLEFTKYKHETSIKHIDNTNEFLDSVLSHCRVALDPRPTERGTTRFTELKFDK